MKPTKIVSALFGVLFVLLLGLTAALAVSSRNASPVLLGSSEAADARTEALMRAVSQGDYITAGTCLAGQPELKVGDAENALSRVLWEAYGDSLSWEFSGGCYACDSGLSRDVIVTGLDIPAVMAVMQESSRQLLIQQAMEAGQEAYEDDGSYRQDFVMEVLAEAAESALAKEDYLTTWELTLSLTCRDGQWWIQPDTGLMNVLTGGMGGA